MNKLGPLSPALREAAEAAKQRLQAPARTSRAVRPALTARVLPVLQTPAPARTPVRALRMLLASGRSVSVRLPGVATHADLQAVALVAQQNARRQSHALRLHARAVDALSRDQRTLEDRFEALQAQTDLALLAALRAPLADRVSEALERLAAQERSTRQLQAGLRRERRFQGQLARGQQVREAVSSMQVAAYGRSGNVFATSNLLLGGSELLWSSIDTLLRRAGWWTKPEAVPLTWLGPLLGLAAGHFTLGQQQYERFVSGDLLLETPGGIDTGGLVFTGEVDLKAHVAKGYWQEFRRRPSVKATARVSDPEAVGIAIAWVEFGTLFVLAASSPKASGQLEVEWTVDVGELGG